MAQYPDSRFRFRETSFERTAALRVPTSILRLSVTLFDSLSDRDAAPADPHEAVLARLRRGEAAAVAEVYDLHHGALRAFARKLTGDAQVAEDLVHDVFVALPKAIKRFRGEAALRTFLLSIAVNLSRKHVRAATRRRAAMSRLALVPEPVSPSPQREAERRQLAAALQRALDDLPLDQRVAFVLCEIEDRTSGEAAAVVGAPEETVRTRLFHARKKLRAFLEKEGVA